MKQLNFYLASLLALAMAGCGGAATPTALPLGATEVRDQAVEALGAVAGFSFSVVHEGPPTDLGGGLTLHSASGVVALPDRAETLAKAHMSALNIAVELGIIQIGQETYLQDPFSGVWRQTESLPFAFQAINEAVADALVAVSSLTLVDDAFDGFVLDAKMPSSALRALVPSAAEDLSLRVRVWVEPDNFLVSRIRLVGPILHGEGPDMVRVVDFTGYGEPAVIRPPL